VDRITKSITDNIIFTKNKRNDVILIPLADIDELQLKSEHVHCLGGQLGLSIISIESILNLLKEENVPNLDLINISEIMNKFLEEFFINALRDTQVFELRYLESKKFDFSQPPENEEKKKEFIEFLLDDRRVVNKSLKLLMENKLVSEEIYRMFLETVTKIYFYTPIDPATAIQIDENNQEPEYLESIKKQQEEIVQMNTKMENLKKKIKINFVNAEHLKKKRENVGGFIVVKPNKSVVENIIELEEAPVVEVVKEEENNTSKNEVTQENIKEEQDHNKTNQTKSMIDLNRSNPDRSQVDLNSSGADVNKCKKKKFKKL